MQSVLPWCNWRRKSKSFEINCESWEFFSSHALFCPLYDQCGISPCFAIRLGYWLLHMKELVLPGAYLHEQFVQIVPFAHRYRRLDSRISLTSVGFATKCIFRNSKSNINANLFYCAWKRSSEHFQTERSTIWASRPQQSWDFYYIKKLRWQRNKIKMKRIVSRI